MKYAVVWKGLVENVILWDGIDLAFATSFKKKQLVPLEDDSISVGWGYADGKFVAPETAEPPSPAAPSVVSMRQAQLALFDAGLYQQVEDAFTAAAAGGEDGLRAAIEWRTATTVERASAVVASLAKALKLKPADLDALFLAASKISN